MKFPGGWQVEVVRPGNAAAYADINHGVDKYVVGVPGQPFEVRVTAPAQQLHAYPQIRVELTVEGRSPNVCYTLTGSQPSGIFKGFVNTVKGQHLTNQFVFGKAERDAAAPATAPGTSKTGGLQVKISQVQQLPGHADPAKHRSYQATSASKAVEGKKWFMQPSLTAQAGRVTGPPVTFSNTMYQHIRTLAELSMQMETAAILILRKVLNPDIPAHQAIIDQSQVPDEEEGEGESAESPINDATTSRSAADDLRATGGDSSRGVKRKIKPEKSQTQSKVVKAEPQNSRAYSSVRGQSEVIDLT
ncbi:hypothetical protein ABBQ32_012443 [Trebouxia sp. C0010 RCD-2024]